MIFDLYFWDVGRDHVRQLVPNFLPIMKIFWEPGSQVPLCFPPLSHSAMRAILLQFALLSSLRLSGIFYLNMNFVLKQSDDLRIVQNAIFRYILAKYIGLGFGLGFE